MIPLKEGDTYAVLSDKGFAVEDTDGFYRHDTRFLSRYQWHLPDFSLAMSHSPGGDRLIQHWSRYSHHSQLVGLTRELQMVNRGFTDKLIFENTDVEPHSVSFNLKIDGDFVDLFVVRKWNDFSSGTVQRQASGNGFQLDHTSDDGVNSAAQLSFKPTCEQGAWHLQLAPRQRIEVQVQGELKSSLDEECRDLPLPDHDQWRSWFPFEFQNERVQAVFNQAVDDLRVLVLPTPYGPYPAAGIPRFVTPFGRDGLLTAMMCLPWAPAMAEGVLGLLAEKQGKEKNDFREEEPGKMFHEIRAGELGRTGRIPFGRYYGTADATPLFLMLLDQYQLWTGDTNKVKSLQAHWEPALSWLARHEGEAQGLITFAPHGKKGLAIQSWKDSPDSMSHADGKLAEPPLAVAEVQGYAYAAYQAAARFYRLLGDQARAAHWQERAENLQQTFHQRFWLEDKGIYALAIDGQGQPLRVLSSDPGHLLWCGIVPEDYAQPLVQTMMSDELWSGWGLRTLGASEVRYNPASYHNGSVWPHDTALFAGGLARYGFTAELEVVGEAMVDLAASQQDLRLPELIAGYTRKAGIPPIPNWVASRPQAWSAAALPYIAGLTWAVSPRGQAKPAKGRFAGRLNYGGRHWQSD